MTNEEKAEAYRKWYRHTKPVAVSLETLDQEGLIEYVEGSTKGPSLYPFVVKLNEPLNNGLCFVCKATDLHQIVAKRAES